MEVLESGMLVQGPRVQKLEREFAMAVGVRNAVATSSGTTALHLALLAHGVGPGDEVITSPFTFVASVNAILYVGAKPVFADVDDETFNIRPELIERAVTPRTKAVMPVHLYGQMADMDPIVEVASRHGLALIEDAAQAVGAKYKGRSAGSIGTGCFSLYATKNVMSGEGGVVTTDDHEIADRVRLLRQHGMRARYKYEFLGYNFRLSDLHAAIGLVQLGRLENFTRRRRANAEFLNDGIKTVATPKVAEDREHVWHQYTVKLGERDRDRVVAELTSAGVGTGIFYPTPVHLFDYIAEVAGSVTMPVAERLAREVISLPVHPALDQADLEHIAGAVNRL